MSIDEMIERGQLERVEPDDKGARRGLDEARRHIASARAILAADANGAYQLAYDAARKAVVADMRRAGLRVRRGEGAHALTAMYARHAVDDALGRRLDTFRGRRNTSEYGEIFFSDAEVLDVIDVASALVEIVAG